MEFGIHNPSAAAASGRGAADTADGFTPMKGEFSAAVHRGEASAGEAPVKTGWNEFGLTFVTPFVHIKEHGKSLGENIKTGTEKAIATDHKVGEDYRSIEPGAERPVPITGGGRY